MCLIVCYLKQMVQFEVKKISEEVTGEGKEVVAGEVLHEVGHQRREEGLCQTAARIIGKCRWCYSGLIRNLL